MDRLPERVIAPRLHAGPKPLFTDSLQRSPASLLAGGKVQVARVTVAGSLLQGAFHQGRSVWVLSCEVEGGVIE